MLNLWNPAHKRDGRAFEEKFCLVSEQAAWRYAGVRTTVLTSKPQG